MPLCYDMQCYALQGALPKLSFLSKLCQPNGHNDQMVLVDPLEGDKSNILLLMGIHGMSSTIGLPMTMTITITTAS